MFYILLLIPLALLATTLTLTKSIQVYQRQPTPPEVIQTANYCQVDTHTRKIQVTYLLFFSLVEVNCN
jgi:hypothetical protein